jgi:4-amino-4-deoxy-L-arabinose transferase-like glycosyltransferase
MFLINNWISGSLILFFGFICLLFFIHFFRKNETNKALFILLLLGLVLRIYRSSDQIIYFWDERYHALVSKNLINHPFKPTLYDHPVLAYDFKDWCSNHVWVHKQPLPLWTMALSMKLFGVNELALRLPSILLTTIGIFIVFVIGKYIFEAKVGLLSAFIFATNGLVLEMTGGRSATDHPDVFFMFFVLLAVYLSVRYVQTLKVYFNIFVGIAIGFAILSKWLPALIVLPVWCLFVLDSKKVDLKHATLQFLLICLVASLVFLPWQLYILNYFPLESKWEFQFNVRHIFEVLDGQGGPFYFFLNRITINYGELVYLPLIYLILKTFQKPIHLKLLALCVWFFIPFLFFSCAKTKMQGYIFFSSTPLFVITAKFWFMLLEYRNNYEWKWLIHFLLFLIAALHFRYALERLHPFESWNERRPNWVQTLKELNEKYEPKTILFNFDKPIEAMFYTDFVVYPFVPNEDKLDSLYSKGYNILINNPQEKSYARITNDRFVFVNIK